ncbi:phage tape measure protein [Klebsiella variicola]|nr:phage tape measure protein [Klebsiella variicola]
MRLSLNQLNVKQFDLEDKYENQVVQRNQLIKEIQDADSRIDSLKGFDPFGPAGRGDKRPDAGRGRISIALTRDSAKPRKTLSVSVMQKHWLSWVYREK